MPDRIVSLAPSATATLRALGLETRLVGVTDHSRADAPSVGGWLTPEVDAVFEADPDLVLTADPLQAELRDALRDRGLEVCHVEPATLDGAFDAVETVGAAAGESGAAADLAAACRRRVHRVRAAVTGRARPVVYCEEWQSPPMVAGNWVPDVVEAAGGAYPFLDAGERSREIDRENVERAAPAHVVVHVCGAGTDPSPDSLADRGWELPAVTRDAVHVADDRWFNRPGPDLVTGVEWLAARLHPDAVEDLRPTDAPRA